MKRKWREWWVLVLWIIPFGCHISNIIRLWNPVEHTISIFCYMVSHICLQILSCKYLTALCCETRLLLALGVIGVLRVDSNYLSSWFWYIAMNFMLLLYFIFFISCHLIAWGSKVFKTDRLEYCSLCSLNLEICFWIQIYNASLDA